MKKLLLFSLLLGVMSIYSQTDEIFGDNPKQSFSISSDYLQTEGSSSFEISFNPGDIFVNGGYAFSLINSTIRYRHFSSTQKAFRLGFNLNYSNASNIIQEKEPSNGDIELRSHTIIYGAIFMPGIEKHFDVSDRISPYVGVQLKAGFKSTSYVKEFQDAFGKIQTRKYVNYPTSIGGAGSGYLVAGIGFVTGVDYYFVKRFYVGAELGIGFQYFSLLNSKYINSNNDSLNQEHKHGYLIQLSPGLTTGNIRLGWTF